MKALIVEDEILAAQNLTKILNEIGSFDSIISIDSIAETIKVFRRTIINPTCFSWIFILPTAWLLKSLTK